MSQQAVLHFKYLLRSWSRCFFLLASFTTSSAAGPTSWQHWLRATESFETRLASSFAVCFRAVLALLDSQTYIKGQKNKERNNVDMQWSNFDKVKCMCIYVISSSWKYILTNGKWHAIIQLLVPIFIDSSCKIICWLNFKLRELWQVDLKWCSLILPHLYRTLWNTQKQQHTSPFTSCVSWKISTKCEEGHHGCWQVQVQAQALHHSIWVCGLHPHLHVWTKDG